MVGGVEDEIGVRMDDVGDIEAEADVVEGGVCI